MRVIRCVLGLAVLGASAVGADPDSTPVPRDVATPPVRPMAACYPDTLSGAEWSAIVESLGALPPSQLAPIGERFFTDSVVWNADGLQAASGRAQPAHLTYSFPGDSTAWGLASISSTGPNELNAKLNAQFGAGNLDLGRELVRQGLAGWRRLSGLTYDEVADDDSPMDEGVTRAATRGDVRIGGIPFGTGTFLAYNAFPSASGLAGVGGADMCLNTSYFLAANFGSSTNNYRYLRNVIAHEHGHGTGNIHVTPCSGTKLMEPRIATGFDLLSNDEARGGARSYGDRFAGNSSAAFAHDFGNLTTPALRSVIERSLSTNGAAGPLGTSADWFRFSLASTQSITITVAPVGGSYADAEQTSGCEPSAAPTINASAAGNLGVELRDSGGATLLASAVPAGAGSTRTIPASSRGPGAYTLRVFDAGPNANQDVQLYDLTIRVGGALAAPAPIAGINKRIAANTDCFFMGDINSRPGEAAATLSPASYDWDLDSDGVFETIGTPQPSRRYPSNGVYPVTLRLTDSGGLSATDTIRVTVFGATTSLFGVAPSTGARGQTVPVTLSGANLKNVTSATHVLVSGTGVTVSGTPAPDALGTSVAGLSLVIASGAALGPRSVSVSNSDGSATAAGAFTITLTPVYPPGPFNLNSPANNAHLANTTPLLQWGTSANATSYTLKVADNQALMSPAVSATITLGTIYFVPAGKLLYKTRFYWSVTAVSAAGSTLGTPATFSFVTPVCAGDANGDRRVDFADATSVLSAWGTAYAPGASGTGDADNDADVDFADVTSVLVNWGNACP